MYVTKRFGYLTASIRNVCISMPDAFVRPLQQMLAVLANTTSDNHETYEVLSNNGTGYWYLRFSDNHFEIGQGLILHKEGQEKIVNKMIPMDSPYGGANIFDWIEEQRTGPIEPK